MRKDATVFGELAIVLILCLMGELVVALLPFGFPASVVALVLLLGLLLAGGIKEGEIERTGDFIVSHMTLYFVPPCIGLMRYFDVILPQIVPFIVICLFTTPIVYLVTAYTAKWMMKVCGTEVPK